MTSEALDRLIDIRHELREEHEQFRKLNDARRLLTVRLLNKTGNVYEIQLSACVSWRVLHSWCLSDGVSLVPRNVLRLIEHEEEAASQKHKSALAKARARSGERSNSDDDRRFRHKEEELSEAKRDWELAHKRPYERRQDDRIDQLQAIVDNWHV